MKPIQVGIIWGAFASFASAQNPQPAGNPIAGKISDVTLYQGTAVVSRQVEVPAEVMVDNFKDKPVNLRMRERIPFMEDTTNLRVSAGEMTHRITGGLLTWRRFALAILGIQG